MSTDADHSNAYFVPRLQKFSRESLTPRMAGFMLSKAWVYALFLSPIAFYRGDAGAALLSFGTLSRDALIITLLVGGLALGNPLERLSGSLKCVIPASCCIVGGALLAFAGRSSVPDEVLIAIASALTGIGSGLLALFWGSVYGKTSGPTAAAEASLAFCFASFLMPAYVLCPSWAQLCVVSALPLGSVLLLKHELARTALPDDPHATAAPLKSAKGSLARIAVSSVVFGLVIMLIRQLYEQQEGNVFPTPTLLQAASAFVAACIVITLLILSKRLDLAFSYRPILLLLALGCFLLPLFEQGSALPYFFARIGYVCFLILNWVMLSDLAFRSSLSPYRVFGIGQAASSFGLLVGALLGVVIQATGTTLADHAQELSGCLVFVLLVAYIFTYPEQSSSDLDKPVQSDEERNAEARGAGPSLEERCLAVAAQHHLGERATEVMILFAKGRSKSRIEQELYISQSTVSFHLRNVYQKLDVHSRQELIDVLEDPSLPRDSFE